MPARPRGAAKRQNRDTSSRDAPAPGGVVAWAAARRTWWSSTHRAATKPTATGAAHASSTATVPRPATTTTATSTRRTNGLPRFSIRAYGSIVPNPRVPDRATMVTATIGRKKASSRMPLTPSERSMPWRNTLVSRGESAQRPAGGDGAHHPGVGAQPHAVRQDGEQPDHLEERAGAAGAEPAGDHHGHQEGEDLPTAAGQQVDQPAAGQRAGVRAGAGAAGRSRRLGGHRARLGPGVPGPPSR